MDTSKITAFVNALNTKFENKQSNKKSDITGDFTEDTTSYPTVQAVKSWVATQMANASNLILGETSTTAYRGDRGKAAYDHSQVTSGNPHNVTKTDVGLSNVTNVAQAPATHVGDNTHLTADQKTAIASIADKANSADLATVATTGSYEDLEDTPSFNNYIEKNSTVGLIKNDGTIDTSLYLGPDNDRFVFIDVSIPSGNTIAANITTNNQIPFSTIPKNFCIGFRLTNDLATSANYNLSFMLAWKYNNENKALTAKAIKFANGNVVKSKDASVGATCIIRWTESYWELVATNDANLLLNAPTALSDLTNDTGFITSANVPTKVSELTNDSGYLTSHQDITGKEDVSNKKASWSATTTNTSYPTEKLVKDSLDNKVDKITGKGLSTNDFTDTYKTSLDNLSTNLDTKTVTVEKKSTTDAGYIASYVVKQNGAQVGSTINIPKDYLVKSATVGTVSTANNPVTGYQVGDKYLDFIINTKDNTGTDEHLYVNVKDLVDTYTAGSGITLTDGQFSISNGAISKAMLASGVQTSLGYADNWNSSAAKNITSANITAWNNKSNLTTADVDSEIEAYLTAITQALE